MNKQKLWVWLDPTNKCNLSCSLCYTKTHHGTSSLNLEEFEKIIDKLFKSTSVEVQLIHLNWLGEPLMNKQFIHFLQYCSTITAPIHWHTNGILLSPKKCEQIVATGTAMNIYVSLDGGNADSHDKNRGQGTFMKSIQGLENLLTERNKQGASHIKIGVYQLDLNVPEAQYDSKFLSLRDELDDYIRVNPLFVDYDSYLLFNKENNPDSDFRNFEIDYLREKPVKACFWAGNSLSIASDGNAYICVLSGKESGKIGNVFQDPLEEIVNRSQAFRSEINELGRDGVSHCKGCYKKEAVV